MFTSYTAVVDTMRERFGDALRHPHRRRQRRGARRRRPALPDRRRRCACSSATSHAAGVGHHADRRHPRRVQRPRLGARQPLAGRGPHPPHRPDGDDVRHLPPRRRHARRLRRRPARAEGGHDRHARGRRPRPRHRSSTPSSAGRSTARPPTVSHSDAATPPRPTMGLLEETLDLLARFRERAALHPRRRGGRRVHRAPASPASCTRCASPTASPCATAPASPTGATASTAAR